MSDGEAYETVVTDQNNRRMRYKSGEIDDERALVCFFYLLARDHLPMGIIEEVVQTSLDFSKNQYTNGWIAQWAQDVTDRMQGAASNK